MGGAAGFVLGFPAVAGPLWHLGQQLTIDWAFRLKNARRWEASEAPDRCPTLRIRHPLCRGRGLPTRLSLALHLAFPTSQRRPTSSSARLLRASRACRRHLTKSTWEPPGSAATSERRADWAGHSHRGPGLLNDRAIPRMMHAVSQVMPARTRRIPAAVNCPINISNATTSEGADTGWYVSAPSWR